MKTKGIKLLILMVITVSSLTGVVNVLGYFIEPPSYDEQIKVSGYVRDSAGNPVEGAWVQLLDENGRLVGSYEFTGTSGYYKVSCIAPRQYMTIKATFRGRSSSITRRCPGTYTVNFYLNFPVNKIAYFFYNTRDTSESKILGYGNTLYAEGFRTFDYINYQETSQSWKSVLGELDSIECSSDYVFLYFAGHGCYFENIEDSYVNLGGGIYSSVLNTELARLESKHIFVVIESCYSGGFSDLFKSNRYIITSTDEVCASQKSPDEGYFSRYFFYAIKTLGYTDTNAFNYAKTQTLVLSQNPQMNDQDSYTWFC